MKILGIETSCDETALALIEARGGLRRPRFRVIKNLVASQIQVHRPFGGVVPNLAKREHLKNLPILLKKLHASGFRLHDVDLIAVTVGPGLEPALWAGITFAKELYKKLKIENSKLKIIGANHLEGHLYSFLLPKTNSAWSMKHGTKRGFTFQASSFKKIFPAIALIVSGGHTVLLQVKDLKTWKKLGETRDDAAGEAFDKVARLLKLPYPGGPEIEKLALSLPKGSRPSINFPRPMLHDKSYDFSFSGLKTAVLYYLRDVEAKGRESERESVRKGIRKDSRINSQRFASRADVAASFQEAAIDVLVHKTLRAAKEFKARAVLLSGGVAANKPLRARLKKETVKFGAKFLVAEFAYNLDNAVMIAAAGYLTSLRGKKYPLRANGGLGI